jgi:GT2 family glycosyltransferase
MKIGFVILNYKTFEKALKLAYYCAENISDKNFVVLVNNDSSDHCEISKPYKILHNFYLINTNKNYGYAKGNNIGTKFLRDNLKCDVIIILNPDVEICNIDYLIASTTRYFNGYSNVCLAYNIISVTPYYHSQTLSSILLPIFYRNIVDKILNKIKNKLDKDFIEVGRFHGCAFAFKAKEFNELDLLDEETFLYGEEIIAALKIKKNGGIIHLAKKVSIYHEKKEVVSTVGVSTHLVDSYSYILRKYFNIPRIISKYLSKFICYQIYFSAVVMNLIFRLIRRFKL